MGVSFACNIYPVGVYVKSLPVSYLCKQTAGNCFFMYRFELYCVPALQRDKISTIVWVLMFSGTQRPGKAVIREKKERERSERLKAPDLFRGPAAGGK